MRTPKLRWFDPVSPRIVDNRVFELTALPPLGYLVDTTAPPVEA